MSLTYILIDYENVQPSPDDLSSIRGADFRVRIFHGSHQSKMTIASIKALQPLGDNVSYFQCGRAGKNALDFRMAFDLGSLVLPYQAPDALPREKPTFLLVSKDGDLDTLLEFVEELGFPARRGATVLEALQPDPTKKKPATKMAGEKTPPAKAAKKASKSAVAPSAIVARTDIWSKVLENLRTHPKNRPTTLVALGRHLKTFLGKDASDAKVDALVERLQKEGVVEVEGKKIAYKAFN